jgi:hypothetical protein
MSRTLTAAMQTAISAKEGYADVWFIEIITGNSDGTVASTLRYATAPTDVSWNSQTWTGIGGVIEFDAPPETSDPSGQSLKLSLSGVDTALITEVLDYELRGRRCRLYWGQILTSTGVVVVDALEVFSGLMNANWEIAHTPSDESTRGSVSVSTTIVSEMARYLFRRMLRTNTESLRLLQTRGGIFDSSNPDIFFQTLPAIVGKPVYWGRVGATANPQGTQQANYGQED